MKNIFSIIASVYMDVITVTGGAGFIGSNFIKYVNKNYENIKIINVDKLSYGSNLANLNGIKNNYKFINKDINGNISQLIENSNYIINFAAESHVDRSISNPKIFINNNINGTLNLLESIRKSKSDHVFIQIGTDEEYGDIVNGSFNENDLLKPSSPYSVSKASSSLLALSYYRTYGIKTIVTRTSNNFGPYQFPEKLIPKTIIRNLLNKPIPVYGNGENIRDWIFVEDNITAILKILFNGKCGEIYNISANNELKTIEIINQIFYFMNKKGEIKIVDDRPGHDVRYSIKSDKVKSLGWKPQYNFSEALKITVNWYINNKQWWTPLINENILSEEPWKLKWQ